MPYAWGLMGVFTFWGGHGNASAIGAVFAEHGVPDNLGLGMILATIGLMAAIIVGMIMVNWGIRKGYAPYVKIIEGQSKTPKLRGIIPPERQRSIGSETVYSSCINSLMLQLIFLLVCLFLGNKLIKWFGAYIPAILNIPMMTHGMIGALIVWPLMVKCGISGYVDKQTISSISGFCLEIIVATAIATLRLDLVTKFFVPIAIYSAVFIVMMIVVCIFVAKAICKQDWFEKCVLHFGQGTGNMGTGLALLRCVDPELKSTAAESVSMANTLTLPITAAGPAILPLLVMRSQSAVVVIGLILGVACLLLGKMFFWRK
jgi:ESS family glutamate:Na+ symporter